MLSLFNEIEYLFIYVNGKVSQYYCDKYCSFHPQLMEPPPSQTDVSIGHPSIFVNGDGSPIKVFTEACGIKGRPKLMRTLRVSRCHKGCYSLISSLNFCTQNFGASLSCDPKSAQIILVDKETTDGKKFIRNWGQDKIILHFAWAKKSIQEGKALLKDCNWGECLAVDDGLPIETEDTDAPELDKSVSFVIFLAFCI